MAFNPNASQLSQEQILQQVFDPTDNTLAVDATVTATISDIEISYEGNTLVVNPDGSLNADVVISASSDSIKSHTYDASGNPIGSTNGGLDVSLIGLNSFSTSQYTIGTSAVQLTPSPLSNRSSISIKAITSTSIYIGNSNTVTTSTGYPLFNDDVLNMDLSTTQQIWAISGSAGQTICVLELA